MGDINTLESRVSAAARPYDMRWGDPNSVFGEFHINKAELKRIYQEGWIKARQVAWRDDAHRTQTIYCFEDIQRWLETIAHQPSRAYIKRFWTAAEIVEAERKAKEGTDGH